MVKLNEHSLNSNSSYESEMLTHRNHLDDAIRIAINGPSLSQWDASNAGCLWWSDRHQQQIGDTRRQPTQLLKMKRKEMECKKKI